MKRLILLLVIALTTSVFSFAQEARIIVAPEANGDFTQVIEVSTDKAQTYRFVREFFATRFKNYTANVKLEDAENGKIICEGGTPLSAPKMYETLPMKAKGQFRFTITIDCKDQRFRIKGEHCLCDYTEYMGHDNEFLSAERGKPYSYLVSEYPNAKISYEQEVGKMLNDMKAFIEKQAKDDDF